jgi:L-alanine-DL-glutamate epimerase-like enolase superfamily enzyme
MQFVDGGILVPTAPGMGIAVNEAKVERYKVKA